MESKNEQKKRSFSKKYKIFWVLLFILFVFSFWALGGFGSSSVSAFLLVLAPALGFISLIIYFIEKFKSKFGKILFYIFASLSTLFITFLLLTGFIVSYIVVDGNSMNGYDNNSNQIICKICKNINKENVVVYNSAKEEGFSRWVIARIVGLPGEEVSINKGELKVNGTKIEEPYADWSAWEGEENIKLGENEYLALYDKRKHEEDFRSTFIFNKSKYIGKIIKIQ